MGIGRFTGSTVLHGVLADEGLDNASTDTTLSGKISILKKAEGWIA